jgi:polyisoprenoid-binding protein YceI
VLDPKASEKDRTQIQNDMLSEKVLDAVKYPEIRFASTKIAPNGAEEWTVLGDLTLHGVTQRVTIGVRRENGRYVGVVTIKQRDFGIAPISIAGGTVKVKDEVKITFSVLPASMPPPV